MTRRIRDAALLILIAGNAHHLAVIACRMIEARAARLMQDGAIASDDIAFLCGHAEPQG